MSDNRYVSVGNDVYIDQKGPEPFPWGWLVIALAGVGVLLVTIFSSPRPSAREYARRAACQSNLKQAALGFLQYQQDYDERLPPVSSSSAAQLEMATAAHHERLYYGWADALQPYLKSTQLYQCPSQEDASDADPLHPGYTDYWFNRNLSAYRSNKLRQPNRTMLLGDANNGLDDIGKTDARYSLAFFPPLWFTVNTTPPYRHLEGANYAFADGHVQWLKPNQFQTLSGVYYTFKVDPNDGVAEPPMRLQPVRLQP